MMSEIIQSDTQGNYPEMNTRLVLNTSSGITLDTPDIERLRQDRLDRTRATMTALDPHVAKEVIPKVDNYSLEDKAAICIQAHFRGYIGRKKYIQLLYEQFAKEEAMRLEKTMKQVEEGELLVENHRLEVQFDDNSTTRKNRSRQYITNVITIQRAWRSYRQRQLVQCSENNNMSPQLLSENEDLSETESATGTQAMSVSTPDDSVKNINVDDEIQSDFDSAGNPEIEPIAKDNDAECDSVLSDYSEMADPLKEHLANVQIIQHEDLETGNTMYPSFGVQQKIIRSPDETEEQFSKRLRKMNFLSLAQEFAALKRIDSDALPFDLHKEQGLYRTATAMSEPSSDEDSGATPVPPRGEMKQNNRPKMELNTTGLDPKKVINENLKVTPIVLRPGPKEAWQEVIQAREESGSSSDITDTSPDTVDSDKLTQSSSESSDSRSPPVENKEFKKTVPAPEKWAGKREILEKESVNRNRIHDAASLEETRTSEANKNQNIPETGTGRSTDSETGGKKTGASPGGSEKSGDFDVYNIESTLPQMDWESLEKQLKKAAEEEKARKSRRNDREEIRRKLAMGDEDYYGGERMFKKPNLQTRLQSGMNLQICFMNDTSTEIESLSEDAREDKEKRKPQQIQPPPRESGTDSGDSPPGTERSSSKETEDEDEDFFAKQAKLQAEARLALAQVRPMAHMQLEVEKMMRKKSPIAEMVRKVLHVGIPGFGERRGRKLSRQIMQEMNLAQIQVVVNDLHTQIESLNEELVKMLMERDDLHMEQDSMLVDIEDLTSNVKALSM